MVVHGSVLIADDEETFRESTSRLLRRERAVVARTTAASRAFSVVISEPKLKTATT